MLEETLKRGFEAMRLPCDGQALERFRIYYDLLEEKNRVMNLTAINGEDESATRHFLDSAAPALRFPLSGKRVIDVGSGAGFPGLPLKILFPDMRLTLLDAQQKRVDFLSEVCAALGFSDVPCLFSLIGIIWKRNAKVRLFRVTAKFFPQKSASSKRRRHLRGAPFV